METRHSVNSTISILNYFFDAHFNWLLNIYYLLRFISMIHNTRFKHHIYLEISVKLFSLDLVEVKFGPPRLTDIL